MADISASEPGTIARSGPDHTPAPPHAPRRDLGTHSLAIGISVIATLIGLIFLAWAILFVTKGRFLKHTFERIASRTTAAT